MTLNETTFFEDLLYEFTFTKNTCFIILFIMSMPEFDRTMFVL